ncbi:MAG: XRE family transcriptional regulator [Acidobacteria bacterium]|nr:MAG: XRE family transcriptional regulator [Acidobacteriota bacterium]
MASSHLAVQKESPAGLPDGMTNTHVRKRVRKLRILKGWTQRELAHAAGISAGSLGCLETGFYRFNLDTLQKIIGALGVGIADVWPSNADNGRVEVSRPPQEAGNQVHFFRLAEVHSLTGADASCLFASRLRLRTAGENPEPELRALYTLRLEDKERWWLCQQLIEGKATNPWVTCIHRENDWALFLCLKNPSMEPWIEKLIRCYLSDWISALSS